MRRLVCLALVIVLPACHKAAPADELFLQSRLPPGVEARYWPPEGWAWGLMQAPGRPAQRYGVSAPAAIPWADVVIMTGYGESAEMWFETARTLNQAGYTVWVLEGAGQAGSGRYLEPRDLGHLPDARADVDGLNLFLRTIVRSPARRSVAVIASGTAWLPAMAAFEQATPAGRLILSAPSDPPTPAGTGKPGERAAGQGGWVRPDAALPRRQKAALGWALANPDLRMGGPSWGWFAVRDALKAQVLDPKAYGRVGASVTVLTTRARSTPCLMMAHCVEQSLAASVPYEQAPDSDYAPWREALLAALAEDHPS